MLVVNRSRGVTAGIAPIATQGSGQCAAFDQYWHPSGGYGEAGESSPGWNRWSGMAIPSNPCSSAARARPVRCAVSQNAGESKNFMGRLPFTFRLPGINLTPSQMSSANDDRGRSMGKLDGRVVLVTGAARGQGA